MQLIAITGVSRGIGYHLARSFLSRGERVFGLVRAPDSPGVRSLAREFGDRFTPVPMDLEDRDSISRAATAVADTVDHIDTVVSNAGVKTADNEGSVEEISEENLLKVFDVNTAGPLRLVQEFLPLIRAAEAAKVVMMSSKRGSITMLPEGRFVPYCVSKAGLNMLTKLLHYHLKAEGIATVALHPGWVRTDMGGAAADLAPEESVPGLIERIDELTLDSPLFVDYRGEELPW